MDPSHFNLNRPETDAASDSDAERVSADDPAAEHAADSSQHSTAQPTANAAGGPVRNPHFDAEAMKSERSYAMWIHLGALIAWVLAVPSSGLSF
jgi:hypothetical protein